ncbi:L,D-transpeptidase [Streptomyces sp. NPDC048290]|uniref:L,D-transpeptidase n=1 Tax=Streptomyces sp. NPDC048290 TaxID=3155811 RepID=UPI003419D084
MRKHLTTLTVATALTSGLLAGAAGHAAADPGASAAASYYLVFDKSGVTSSRLYLKQSVPGRDKVIADYKAGSGTIKNTCAVGKGWLPNGDYKIEFHRKNFDGIINGYVIKLSDKSCHAGTRRTELFIHSEMRPNGQQGRIESERWTDENPNDYYSNGCIKLRPSHIKNLFNRLDDLGWSKLKKLKVVS